MMLNETALRKPEFKADAQVTLADGQLWSLPLPQVCLFPVWDQQEKMTVKTTVVGFGSQYEQWYETLRDSSADQFARWTARFGMATTLLAHNYTIESKDFSALLQYIPSNSESIAMWNRLDLTVLGIGVDGGDEDAE
jgi:hypothetical protein